MDEPLSALDKKLRDQMQIELRSLHENLGMTTVYVTHDQREALTMSDRIAVVNHGKIMQLATPRNLYEHPANRFVADFIGDSTFLPVQKKGARIAFGSTQLNHTSPVPEASKLLLMARPERFRLLDGPADEGMNTFDAVAQQVVYQGDSYLLNAKMHGGEVISMRGAVRGGTVDALPSVGDSVTLGLAPEDTVIIDGQDV